MMKRIDWQKISQWPQNVAQRLESYNPVWARKVLNYASQISDPALLGSLFELEEWSDQRVGLTLPARSWSVGSLVVFAEFMVRSLWARHMPHSHDAIRFVAVSASLQGTMQEGLKMRLELTQDEREQWFHDLLGSGQVQKTIVVRVWSTLEVFRGEIALTIDLRHAPALPSGPSRS